MSSKFSNSRTRYSESNIRTSLAVLPLLNASGDPEQQYLSDGITEDLIIRMSRVPGLYVISRDQAFAFAEGTRPLDEVALELGVQHLLQGSVRKIGDRIVIAARLVDAHIDKQSWARTYSRSFNQIFHLQLELSRDVAVALRLDVPQATDLRHRKNPDVDIEAYRFYLMGRSYFHRGYTRHVMKLARRMFQRAVDIQPDYAEGHAGVADCCAYLLDAGDYSVTTEEILKHSERALSLDPTLAEAHTSRGLALYTINRYEEAEQSFERAMELQPDLFEAYYRYGRNCVNQKQFEKAVDLFKRAAELKRDDYRSLGLQAMCLQSLMRLSEARTVNMGALARTERAVAQRPDEADALSFGAGILADLGELTRTRDWAQRALAIDPDDYIVNYNIACAFASLGKKDEAISILERIYGPDSLPSQKEYMIQDSDLYVLHDHPRFKALLTKMKG